MSDNSEDELFNYDKDSDKSPARNENEDGDPDIALRDEDPEQDRKSDPDAEGPPEGEDMDDAGYGGDDAIGNDEKEDIQEDIGGYEEDPEENIGEIDYDKGLDDEEDFEYGDSHRDRKKDKKKKGGERSIRRKKANRDDEAEEDPNAEDEEDGKKKKGRKGKQDYVDEESLKDLLGDMNIAYEKDVESFMQKRPALNKLQLLPKVENLLKRFIYQKALVDNTNGEGLETLRKWLTKSKHGPPPALQIKKTLLDIILQLPVSDFHLKDSRIGQVIYNMKNNQNEDADLKKTIKDIIDKWTRVITDTNDSYSLAEEMRDRKKIAISLDDYRQQSMSSLRRSIPKMVNKRSGFDYVYKPEQNRGQRNLNARQQASEVCDKVIKDMKRKMKKEPK